MRALLVRHGEAVESHLAPNDDERWLTANGRATTQRVAARLAEVGIRPTAYFCSPLVRAVQTAEILAGGTGFTGAVTATRWLHSTGTTVARMAGLLDGARDDDLVCLVGHEPSIRVLAGHLAGIQEMFGFRTSAACLILPNSTGSRFVWMLDPRTLQLVESLDALAT